MLEVLSLGAGVQSTTIALMAAHGEITPAPDVAIFADTKGESAATYEHLEWLASGNVLPFPVEIVSWRNLEDDVLRTAAGEKDIAGRANGYSAPPFRTRTAKGKKGGMLRRECTKNYKIVPIQQAVRRHLGKVGKRIRSKEPLARQWIGFSANEFTRAGLHKNQPPWIALYYPLIDEHFGDGLGGPGSRWMSYGDCINWLRKHDYPTPPRSACVFCPYLKNERWVEMRDNQPEDWERALIVDEAIRDMAEHGVADLRQGGQLYLHHQLVPLREAEIDSPDQEDMWSEFTDECEGMCGV